MMIQVFDANWDRTVYAYLTHSLDLPQSIDLSTSRSWPGVANFENVGGRLLVSSGIEPSVTSYEISDDLRWTEGGTISFINYGFEDANLYGQFVVDENTVYYPYGSGARLIWSPTTMTVTQDLTDTSLAPQQNGLALEGAGNRGYIHFKNGVEVALDYSGEEGGSPDTFVAVYDPQTHTESSITTIPCPGLGYATQDEQGNTYYTTWNSSGIIAALFGVEPKPCHARLKPDHTLDWTSDLRDLTDGRYVNSFLSIGQGKAVGNVLHHELVDADWNAGYNDDVAAQLSQDGAHWRLWLFDLENHEAHPIEGISEATGATSQVAVLDGRVFLFVRYNNWDRSKIYEIDREDGIVTERSDTVGDVHKWIRIR